MKLWQLMYPRKWRKLSQGLGLRIGTMKPLGMCRQRSSIRRRKLTRNTHREYFINYVITTVTMFGKAVFLWQLKCAESRRPRPVWISLLVEYRALVFNVFLLNSRLDWIPYFILGGRRHLEKKLQGLKEDHKTQSKTKRVCLGRLSFKKRWRFFPS